MAEDDVAKTMIEDVLTKWSRRGYLEPEFVKEITADLHGELNVLLIGSA